MPVQRAVLPAPNHLLNATESADLHPFHVVPASILIPRVVKDLPPTS
jgi:hypothetical protein